MQFILTRIILDLQLLAQRPYWWYFNEIISLYLSLNLAPHGRHIIVFHFARGSLQVKNSGTHTCMYGFPVLLHYSIVELDINFLLWHWQRRRPAF
jgi:hypothetical protein